MTRTQTPISRWMKSSRTRFTIVAVFATIVILLPQTMSAIYAHKKIAAMERIAIETAGRFNTKIRLMAPPHQLVQPIDGANAEGTHTARPLTVECDGDRVKLTMQYDLHRNSWIELIGEVHPSPGSQTNALQNRQDAVHASLEDIKKLSLIQPGSQVRVTKTRYLIAANLWKVTWEVLHCDKSVSTVTTIVDVKTGLPTWIYNGEY